MLMWANLRLFILATTSLASLTQAVQQHQTPTNPTTTRSVTISNVHNRYNVSGNIMDAHDGTYNKWSSAPDAPWYYYAMGYGDCRQDEDLCNGKTRCGYGFSWIGVWTSPDLSNNSWTLVREARDDTWPKCVYFRVHTIYNAQKKQYVMWANLNNNGATSGDCLHADYAVGTSNSPEGPFTYVHGIKAGRGSHGGDFDLFVDDDDVAYLIYTDVAGGHTMAVERLTEDYLQSAATKSGSAASNVSSGVFGNVFVEAPAMFKRKGVYYALFGNCCCFCGQGSGIGVYTSVTSPLGPWVYHDNVGCNANTTLTPGCGCGMDHGIGGGSVGGGSVGEDRVGGGSGATCSFYGDSLTRAQQNFVIRVPQVDGSVEYVWTGDRWQSANDGVKAHDLQYWSVLKFTEINGIELPVQFVWEDEIVVHV
jgi:hypothetical protein